MKKLYLLTLAISLFFSTTNAQNTIATEQPAVTIGSEASEPDPIGVCVGSVIDVPFWSTGVYNNNNVYTAQLSDSSGSFDNPQIIGTSPDATTYDPALVPSPGNVAGEIPSTPPGCNYYIRVVSSNPVAVIEEVFGPFCIIDCDIEANNGIDLHFCVTPMEGDSALIFIEINMDTSNVTYNPGNEFQIEILDTKFFERHNLGDLGVIASTTSCSLWVKIPPVSRLNALGLEPSEYYMRIIATDSDDPDNQLGSLIRVTIGYSVVFPLNITATKTEICVGDIVFFNVLPFNKESQYQWYFDGSPFPPNSPSPSLGRINFTGIAPGTHFVNVQETNYGCVGEISPPLSVEVIPSPIVNISGPSIVCFNDTMVYTVPFINNTYYEWIIPPSYGTIVDTSHHPTTVTVVWNKVDTGSCDIGIFAINKCGSVNESYEVFINPILTADAGLDDTICNGENKILSASGGKIYEWNTGEATSLIIVNPTSTTTYTVTVTGCDSNTDSDDVVVTVIDCFIIKGKITHNGDSVISGYVNLYEYDINAQMLLIDSVEVDSTGNYEFIDVQLGQYIINAYADTSLYANTIRTYYNNEYYWDSATVISVLGDTIIDNINISIITLPILSGNDTISGTITNELSDSLENIDVLLKLVPDSIVGHTLTNSSGYFEFANVPNGTYHILVDIPGLPMDSVWEVSISKSLFPDCNYIVDATHIYIPTITNINNIYNETIVSIYPNPANNKLNIEIKDLNNDKLALDIISISGQVMYSKEYESKIIEQIDISNYPKGIYFVKVTSDNFIKFEKIIKL